MCDVQQGKVEPLSNKRVTRVFRGIVYGNLGLKWFEMFALTFQASFHLHLQFLGAFLYTNSCASPAGPLGLFVKVLEGTDPSAIWEFFT